MSPTARYFLRAGFATALAGLSAVGTAIPDGISSTEWIIVATAVVGAASAYLGFGAASENLEPNVGNTKPAAEIIAEQQAK